MNITFQASRD